MPRVLFQPRSLPTPANVAALRCAVQRELAPDLSPGFRYRRRQLNARARLSWLGMFAALSSDLAPSAGKRSGTGLGATGGPEPAGGPPTGFASRPAIGCCGQRTIATASDRFELPTCGSYPVTGRCARRRGSQLNLLGSQRPLPVQALRQLETIRRWPSPRKLTNQLRPRTKSRSARDWGLIGCSVLIRVQGVGRRARLKS